MRSYLVQNNVGLGKWQHYYIELENKVLHFSAKIGTSHPSPHDLQDLQEGFCGIPATHVSNVEFQISIFFNQKEFKQGCILKNLYLAPAPLTHTYLIFFPLVLTLETKLNLYTYTLYPFYFGLS